MSKLWTLATIFGINMRNAFKFSTNMPSIGLEICKHFENFEKQNNLYGW